MRIYEWNSNLRICGEIALLIFIDQISKYLIRHWGGFYICNKGIAFGMTLSPITFWLFWVIITALIILQIFNFQFSIFNKLPNLKFKNFDLISNFKLKISNYSLILILSGAISNILDRLYFGCVIDFIKLPYWPFFNLADTFIVIGVIISVTKILNSKF